MSTLEGGLGIGQRPSGLQRTESKQPSPTTFDYVIATPAGQSSYASGQGVEVAFDATARVIVARDRQTGRIVVAGAKSNSDKGSIPDGRYEILETQRSDRFLRLDAIDKNPRNDVVEFEGHSSFTALRLHIPGGTLGCIALDTYKNWEKIQAMIMSSSPKIVNDESKVREFAKVQFEVPDPLGVIDSGTAIKRGELTVGRMNQTPSGQNMTGEAFHSLMDVGAQSRQLGQNASSINSGERTVNLSDRPTGIPLDE